MTHQIGILFWGCKGGHRNFCDNGVIDVYSPVIRQTYKDVRSFATFSVVNTDFYALEFTADYKVYTHYRSSNDSGSGAFIALTIYVPHSLQVKGIRQIMDKMVDEYFEQYFNPITNSPIPGMVDDITPFQQMFDQYAASNTVPDHSRFYKRPSVQDDTPKILAYSSLDELDAYFASPYRPEFFSCQEVMLISKEILQNQSLYGLRFQVAPTLIEHVSEPVPEPFINLFPASQNFRLTQFAVNGTDYTSRQGDVPLYADDRISMSIEGSPYQRPIVVDNLALEEVLQLGLIKKNARGFEFLEVYNLDYADFNLPAHIEGDQSGSCYQCFALRSTEDPRVIIPGAKFDPRTSTFVFAVSGKYLQHRFRLIYSLTPDFSISTLIIPLMDVDLEALITQGVTLEVGVRKHVFLFSYEEKAPQSILFKITSADKARAINGHILNPSGKAELYLPQDFTFDLDDVQLHADGFNIKLDSRGRYQVYPQMVEVEIAMPKYLASFNLDALLPKYSIGGEEYKGYWDQGRCFIRLPFEWTDQQGKLIIDGNSFPFEELSRTRISFKCAVVSNRTDQPVAFDVIFEDNHKVTRRLQPGTIDILPSNIDVRIAPELRLTATVQEKGFASDNRTKLFLLVPRQIEPITTAQGFVIDEQNAGFSQSASQIQTSNSVEGSDKSDAQTQTQSQSQSQTQSQSQSQTQSQSQSQTQSQSQSQTQSQSQSNSQFQSQSQSHSTDEQGDTRSSSDEDRHPGHFTDPSEKARGRSNRGHGNGGSNGNGNRRTSTSGQGGGNRSGDHTGRRNASGRTNEETDDNQQGGTSGSTPNVTDSSNNATPAYFIKLINCESLYARLLQKDHTYKIVPIANLNTADYIPVNRDRSQVKLLDGREKEVCVINFPQQDYLRDTLMDKQNKENGFDVNWVDDNRCMVYYQKNSFLSKLRNAFNSSKGLLAGVVSILIIAAITACWIFFTRTSEDYSMAMRFAVNNPTTVESKISYIGFKENSYKGDSLVLSNNGDVLNIPSSENPKFAPSTGGAPSELYVIYQNNQLVPILKDNSVCDTAFKAVIFPEDIRVVSLSTDSVNASSQSSTQPSSKGWDMDSVFYLLSNPKKIDRNIALRLELPPLSLLNAWQQLRKLVEIDDQLIDSLIKVYPDYEARIVKLKHSASEESDDTQTDQSTDASAQDPTQSETVPAEGGAVKKPSEGSQVAKTTPVQTAPAVDPNEAVKKEYREKIAKLDGVFTRAMVDDAISFRNANKTALGDEIGIHKHKLNAYYNFVYGNDYDISQFTEDQKKAINGIREIKPDLISSRDYPAIYAEYQRIGG